MSLSYETAKKLKEAGFEFNKVWLERNGTYAETPYNFDKEYLIPTLSDLIKACGDDFGGLVFNPTNTSDKWDCYLRYELHGNEYGLAHPTISGNSLEEVVASLWLKINNKNA